MNPFLLRRAFTTVLLACAALLPIGCGASTMASRISDARVDLAKVTASAEAPKKDDLKNMKGIAIMSVGQGGVGIGGEGGGGLLLKKVDSCWGAPFAVDAAAGSIGLQLGGQVKHFIVVFYDDGCMQDFARGGMQLLAVGEGTGGSATGNTRSSSAQYKAFIAGAGLYGGLQLGGLNYSPAKDVNTAAYGSATLAEILDGKVKAPPGALSLTSAIDGMR
jgi:lipid-binding SYLF domain-containing protein